MMIVCLEKCLEKFHNNVILGDGLAEFQVLSEISEWAMKIENALKFVGEEASLEAISSFWDEFEKTAPEPFLEESVLLENARFCSVHESLLKPLMEAAAKIRCSPELSGLVRYVHWTNFVREGEHPKWPADWPLFKSLLGEEHCGCVYLLAAAGYVPQLKAYHKALGLPDEITRGTAAQVGSYAENYRRGKNGFAGLYPRQYSWLRNYLFGNLYFRIGRFEYWSKPYGGQCTVCRHKTGRNIVTFAKGELKFDKYGFALDQAAVAPEHEWTSELIIGEDSIKGHPVAADGSTSKKLMELSLGDWEIILREGTAILDMHIPAGGGMDTDTSFDSFRRAKAFFEERFPEKKHVAVICQSWVFNPNLPEVLPSSSNLVRLLKNIHLYPTASSREEGFWFIFLMDKFDLATASRESSLQRAILDYISCGRRWRGGGMFVLLDEIK
ncbi:MAG: hypothetical protein A2X49_03250 [Lentisphaerae bacterium GWF2_52_8]|nr:MAG: hypothetical protein A2X49_03250 [Lentisphaerae bacterium GWF2_52_8]